MSHRIRVTKESMKHPNETVRAIVEQRAKSHLAEITDMDEVAAIREAGLGAPHVYSNRVNARIHFWSDADELRAWRATHTSKSEQP